MNSESLTRRKFIHHCAICTGAAGIPATWTRLLAAAEGHAHRGPVSSPGGVPLEFKYFTPEQAATVEAVAEQIIPADEDPGAKWAGVVHYIDLSLAVEFKENRPAYEAGLRRLAALTHEVAAKPFVELDFAAQTRILERLEKDNAREGQETSGSDFFRLVRRQTLEGFFGDPKYGGNRDHVGWKILKFEG